MEPHSAKSQIVERLNQATNVLVTVSSNPSVDQLAACIGMTLTLNKLGKHGTAVFSGEVPSTLEFLKPEETIEKDTDSLQDFIIALDKAKADKLRYKVEDQFVKIFITPYRSSIDEKDLEFSHGDFNVDVVLAIGVHKKDELDQAITSHGRILHDATVISINTGTEGSDLGTLNWYDAQASSLCEMLVDMSQTLKEGILDGQMATAYLTGIVAETERFSNAKTTSRTMTLAAQLMAAGANQQLVASKLHQPTLTPALEPTSTKPAPVEAELEADGSLKIGHPDSETKPLLENEEDKDDGVSEIHIDEAGKLKSAATASEWHRGDGEAVADTPNIPQADFIAPPEDEKVGNIDPLSASPISGPTLTHDTKPATPPAVEPPEPPKPVTEPSLIPKPVMETPAPPEEPTEPHSVIDRSEGPARIEPLAPAAPLHMPDLSSPTEPTPAGPPPPPMPPPMMPPIIQPTQPPK